MTGAGAYFRPAEESVHPSNETAGDLPPHCSDPADTELVGEFVLYLTAHILMSFISVQLGRKVEEFSKKADCDKFEVALALAIEG